MPTRTKSGKLLVAPSLAEDKAVVGKFSIASRPAVDVATAPIAEDEPIADLPSATAQPPRALLLRAESSGSLRRGTPRPTDLKKTLSTVKFVLEQSGLDQVEEEDYDMA